MNLVLLNALRRDAKEDFFANGELLFVATDDWVECVNGGFTLRVLYCTEYPESCDAVESPREWK